MIIVRLRGGLGNQLFQYATGRALALRSDTEMRLDRTQYTKSSIRSYWLDHFNIRASAATPKDLQRVRFPSQHLWSKIVGLWRRDIRYVHEQRLAFDHNILELNDSVYLDGYWQTERYFSSIREVLLDELSLNERLDPGTVRYLDQIRSCCNAVSLHVRRGDFVNEAENRRIHDVCVPDYFSRCLNLLAERFDRFHIFVFSDDIEWVKANLRIDTPVTFLERNQNSKDYQDLALMCNCDHHITANRFVRQDCRWEILWNFDSISAVIVFQTCRGVCHGWSHLSGGDVPRSI